MHCEGCGFEAVSDGVYCTRCGARLRRDGAHREADADEPRLVVSLTPRQILTYGVFLSIALFASAVVALWLSGCHLGPGIDSTFGMIAVIAALTAIVVLLVAAMTAIRMLGADGRSTRQRTSGREDRRPAGALPLSPGTLLSGPPASIVEHTTFPLTVPASGSQARDTADQQ